jgi:hypothetical protein
MPVPPTADEARRLVDVYYRSYYTTFHVEDAEPDLPPLIEGLPNPDNTGWTVHYTANGTEMSVRVVGYTFFDLLPSS